MGACYSGTCTQITVLVDKTKVQKTQSSKPIENNEILNDNTNNVYKLESEFENMPEWEGERYKGYGIKRMKEYKSYLENNSSGMCL
ncbi:MAG: hypothetical protein MJ252_26400 [archaeon]|nr:hypothetical protein [archaeon]